MSKFKAAVRRRVFNVGDRVKINTKVVGCTEPVKNVIFTVRGHRGEASLLEGFYPDGVPCVISADDKDLIRVSKWKGGAE